MSTLTTAIDILQCFSFERSELRVSEVSRQLDVPKSTVSRLFKQMLNHGLVEQNPESRAYRPGPLVFRLGSLYQAHLGILDLVEEAVERLVVEFGLTGYIGVLDGSDVVILRVRQGSYPVRMILNPGYRIPAFATAIGKAILSRLDDGVIKQMHPAVLHRETTDFTITINDLIAEIRAARSAGWTEANGRVFPGFGAVAVAVAAGGGQQPLAFCLSYPSNAGFDQQQPEMVTRLLDAAADIGRRAGDPYWMMRSELEPGVGRQPSNARTTRQANEMAK